MCQGVLAKHKRGGQSRQVGQVVGRERVARPGDSAARVRIERANVQASQCRPIVVPGQAQVWHTAQQIAALIRIGAVPDHIAQAPDEIPVPLGILQNRLESSEVGVNVGDN